ncbi:response regulator transcription factor [Chloroflexota bacterium]
MSENRLPKVLVVANEILFAEGICALLENCGVIDIAGRASSAEEALERARELLPDVVLMDTAIPSEQVIYALHEEIENVRVLLIGHDEYHESIFRGFKAGAKGYVSSSEPGSLLVSALLDIYHGNYFLSTSAVKMLVAEYCRIKHANINDPYLQLTNREREVLRLLAEGHGSKGIANLLHISSNTVMGYKSRINRKLNIRNTSDLTKYILIQSSSIMEY